MPIINAFLLLIIPLPAFAHGEEVLLAATVIFIAWVIIIIEAAYKSKSAKSKIFSASTIVFGIATSLYFSNLPRNIEGDFARILYIFCPAASMILNCAVQFSENKSELNWEKLPRKLFIFFASSAILGIILISIKGSYPTTGGLYKIISWPLMHYIENKNISSMFLSMILQILYACSIYFSFIFLRHIINNASKFMKKF